MYGGRNRDRGTVTSRLDVLVGLTLMCVYTQSRAKHMYVWLCFYPNHCVYEW